MRRKAERGRGEGMENTEGRKDTEEDWGERGLAFVTGRKSIGQINEQTKNSSVYDKLEHHPVFKQGRVNTASIILKDNSEGWRPRTALKLIAYDGLGRLFVWDSERKQLHYLEIQRSDSLQAFSSEASTLFASREFQTVQLSSPVDFQVLHLAFNRTGRSLVLVGDEALVVLNLLAPSSAAASGLCRVQKVGSEQIFSAGDGLWLRILQIAWHPHSDTHLGVLSSDGCFRMRRTGVLSTIKVFNTIWFCIIGSTDFFCLWWRAFVGPIYSICTL